MALIHNLGFPRMGAKRELKFALERYWKGESTADELQSVAREIRRQNWQLQGSLDLVPVGDFSLYDQVLDMSQALGNLPTRVARLEGSPLDNYFRVARGRSARDNEGIQAGEMTKWFDTNYHYIVPEVTADTVFRLDAKPLLSQLTEAQAQGVKAKPVIIGPVTYLWLSKAKDGSNRLDLLPRLLPVYSQLLQALAEAGADWVQIDEPALVTELAAEWQAAFSSAYNALQECTPQLLLTTYFGPLEENLALACELPVAGLHLDGVRGRDEVIQAARQWPRQRVLSLGVIDGRNIWKTDLNATLDWLQPLAAQRGEQLWIAPSCSLLHVPVDLESEQKLDAEIRHWLAFARQKLEELELLGRALNEGPATVAEALNANRAALDSRARSSRVHNPLVKAASQEVSAAMGERQSPYAVRAARQHERLRLPLYPTTTIGSFPRPGRSARPVRPCAAMRSPETSMRRGCGQRSNTPCASRSNWGWMCWCMAKRSATTWWNTSASSWKASPSASSAGYSPTALAASNRRSSLVTSAAPNP